MALQKTENDMVRVLVNNMSDEQRVGLVEWMETRGFDTPIAILNTEPVRKSIEVRIATAVDMIRNMKTGRDLEGIMTYLDINQSQFGRAVGISQSYISLKSRSDATWHDKTKKSMADNLMKNWKDL